MNEPLSSSIEETIKVVESDVNVRKFIMDILNIERAQMHRKNIEFEEALTKALRRGTD